MFKKIKNFIRLRSGESGRSMVEMLGVLAVIGVLTLGGLAGYNYAMNKHRANTILSEIMLRYVVAEQQMTLGAPINMSEFEDTVLGDYKIDVYKSDDMDGVIEFRLSNVPVDVARQLFNSNSGLWKLPLAYFDLSEQEGVIASPKSSYQGLVPDANAIGPLGLVGIVIGVLVGTNAVTCGAQIAAGNEITEEIKGGCVCKHAPNTEGKRWYNFLWK